MNKSRLAMITSALTIGLISSTLASATELVFYDFSPTQGKRISTWYMKGWTSISECTAAKGDGAQCMLFLTSDKACGQTVVYTTLQGAKDIIASYSELRNTLRLYTWEGSSGAGTMTPKIRPLCEFTK